MVRPMSSRLVGSLYPWWISTAKLMIFPARPTRKKAGTNQHDMTSSMSRLVWSEMNPGKGCTSGWTVEKTNADWFDGSKTNWSNIMLNFCLHIQETPVGFLFMYTCSKRVNMLLCRNETKQNNKKNQQNQDTNNNKPKTNTTSHARTNRQ